MTPSIAKSFVMLGRPVATFFAIIGILASSSLAAETIVRRGAKNLSGDISDVSKTEVVVKVKSIKEETITVPANEIVSIEWTGEAPEAGIARADDAGGRYANALAGYQKSLQTSKSTNANAKLDLEFGIARVTSRMALNDAEKLDGAIKLIEDFRAKDHYRHFEATELLGELQLAKRDIVKATSAFEAMGRAPWKSTKLRSKNQLARIKIAEQKLDDAMRLYEEITADTTEGTGEKIQKMEAQLGKSRVMIARQQSAEALTLLTQVIDAADPDEVALNAEAFLRQGDCLRELGRDKDAVLAYLRVDTLFASAKPQHAEALFQLSKLWGKVGRPERGEDARDRLTDNYPNSEWTSRLKVPAASP